MIQSRREFPARIKLKILERAMDKDGRVICEGCGLVLGKKKYEFDHTIAEALIIDKTRELTADDGKLLGKECCHRGGKTASDVKVIAKAKRNEKKFLGIRNVSSRPIPGSKASGIKKKFNGEVVFR